MFIFFKSCVIKQPLLAKLTTKGDAGKKEKHPHDVYGGKSLERTREQENAGTG